MEQIEWRVSSKGTIWSEAKLNADKLNLVILLNRDDTYSFMAVYHGGEKFISKRAYTNMDDAKEAAERFATAWLTRKG